MKIIPIAEYIKLSKEERQKHLDLNQPCLERGGFSTKFCGVLAEGLGTTIPVRKLDGVNVHLCHACHNAKCSNVKHMYWGTPKENSKDAFNNGKASPWKNTVNKYGIEKSLEMIRKNQKLACSLGGQKTAVKRKAEKKLRAVEQVFREDL